MILTALTTLAAILPGSVDVLWTDPQPQTPPYASQAATALVRLQAVEARHRRHRRHHRKPPAPMTPALASYYDLDGTGACGVGSVQSGLRFASLFLSCGTRVRFCHVGRCVEAWMSDRGPYVSGRTFDLNVNLKQALACSDLCEVLYRVG